MVDVLAVRSFPATLGFGAGLAVLQGVFDFTGGSLQGIGKDPNVDEYERKEELRRSRRRPIQETLDELGEGRGKRLSNQFESVYHIFNVPLGIYGPGYRERRADRIKAAYGIEVPRT